MIELITGLPGSGKTLSAVERIVQARQEGRPVYVAGLDGLDPSLGCIDIDPLQWQDAPDGSLIVVDEAQKWMPTRVQRDPIPPIMALSEHRHRGFDFILITQSPAMLDAWVRRLVGRHVHVLRKFGTHNCERIIWGECVDDPQSTSMRARGQSEVWRYPAALFQRYRSATLHTHKARLPWRVIILPIVLAAAAFGIWWSMNYLDAMQTASAAEPKARRSAEPRPQDLGRTPVAPAKADAPITVDDYLTAITPRVVGMPWSAPIFDGAKPTELPRIACILAGKSCRCYTEQATPIRMQFDRCATIARFGVYRPAFERAPPVVATAPEPATTAKQ